MASFSSAIKAPLVTFLCALFAVTAAAQGGSAARVTRVIKDVKIIEGQNTRVAALNAAVPEGAVVRTAAGSRAEITLSDQIVVRFAGNTFLSLGAGALALNQGAILFEAPRGSRNAKIAVGAITVDTTGTTGILERFGGSYVKILLLQGKARVFLPRKIGESVLVDAGQILIAKPDAKTLPEAADFDIARLYKTSVLTNAGFRQLASKPLIDRAIAVQKKNPKLNATNLVIFGRGTMVNLVDPAPSIAPTPKTTASPTPKVFRRLSR